VLRVDDQSLFRRAIATLIDAQEDMSVVGQADDGRAGLALVAEHRPDVVLLDMEMPVMDGLEAARAITARHPATSVVMLTVNDDDEHFLGAIRAGAQGYLLKDLHPAELFDQIRSAARGRTPISPTLLPRLLEHVRRSEPAAAVPEEDGPGNILSERELEILRLAAEGLSNREIGRRLFITEGTVKNHVHNALRKLGLENRVQATAYLVEEGLVHRPEGEHPLR
jgi:two-component system nitrate/nitrite response regulator NarL